MLCPECRLVLGFLEGCIDRLEPLIVADVFDYRLYLPKSGFNTFQLLAGTVMGAVNVLSLCFKVCISRRLFSVR